MSTEDLQAMAVYLKSLGGGASSRRVPHPNRGQSTTAKLTAAKDPTLGAHLYVDNCGA